MNELTPSGSKRIRLTSAPATKPKPAPQLGPAQQTDADDEDQHEVGVGPQDAHERRHGRLQQHADDQDERQPHQVCHAVRPNGGDCFSWARRASSQHHHHEVEAVEVDERLHGDALVELHVLLADLRDDADGDAATKIEPFMPDVST